MFYLNLDLFFFPNSNYVLSHILYFSIIPVQRIIEFWPEGDFRDNLVQLIYSINEDTEGPEQ